MVTESMSYSAVCAAVSAFFNSLCAGAICFHIFMFIVFALGVSLFIHILTLVTLQK